VGVLWHTAEKVQAIHSLEAPSNSILSKMRLQTRRGGNTMQSCLAYTLFLISIGQYLLPQILTLGKEGPNISRSLRVCETSRDTRKKLPYLIRSVFSVDGDERSRDVSFVLKE
jgi:hypothetical protein